MIWSAVAEKEGEYFSDSLKHDAVIFVPDSESGGRLLLGVGDNEDGIGSTRSSISVDNRGRVTCGSSLTCASDVSLPSGRLGLGTSNPVDRLDVRGDTARLSASYGNVAWVCAANTEGSAGSDFSAEFRCSSGGQGEDEDEVDVARFGCSPYRKSYWSYAGKDRVTIDRDGYVGVGTTDPSARLHVKDGNCRVEGGLRVDRGATVTAVNGEHIADFSWVVDGDEGEMEAISKPVLVILAGKKWPIDDEDGSNSDDSNEDGESSASSGEKDERDLGRVGIRTASPRHALHVQDGDIFTNGQFLMSSDARLKSELVPITSAVDKICRLNGYTFVRNGDSEMHANAFIGADGNRRREAGMLAQDVMAVLPEAVFTDERGYMSLAYGNMMALVIEGVKELAAGLHALASASTASLDR